MGISSTCVFFNLIFEKSQQKKQQNNQIYLILHLLIVARHFGFHGAQNLPTDPTDPTDPTTDPTTVDVPGLELSTATGLDVAEDRQFFVLLGPRGLGPKDEFDDFETTEMSDFCYKMGEGFKKKQRRHNCLGKTKEEL